VLWVLQLDHQSSQLVSIVFMQLLLVAAAQEALRPQVVAVEVVQVVILLVGLLFPIQ
jgi:hypothetical protein